MQTKRSKSELVSFYHLNNQYFADQALECGVEGDLNVDELKEQRT
jgi:hypothetical protein